MYFTAETRDLVTSLAREEIDRFGYEYDLSKAAKPPERVAQIAKEGT
jgi:hypothetical protein